MLEIQSSSRGQQKFFIFIQQKNFEKFFIFILCLKSIGKYRLYLLIPILLANTTKIGRYHRYRYSSIGTSLIANTHTNLKHKLKIKKSVAVYLFFNKN